jgi:myo-inositol catabolism protein IolC
MVGNRQRDILDEWQSGPWQIDSDLIRWAGDKILITASFYFWNSGTELQKSQVGLLQSILHEALTRQQDLIPPGSARSSSNAVLQRPAAGATQPC